jgi:dCTP deaminase
MTVLAAQDIPVGIVTPWVGTKQICPHSGMSYGLSVCGYDLRIKQRIVVKPGDFVLASTIEYFDMPDWIVGIVHDKSSLARMGIALQNTVIESGWKGWLTLEITNHGREEVVLESGQPIAQVLFHALSNPTIKPYDGKYQNQPDEPVGAIHERCIPLQRAV